MTKLGTLELELKLLKNEFDAEMRRLNGQVQAFEDRPALKPKVDTKEVTGAKRHYQSLNSEHSKTAQAINSNVISPVFDSRSLRQAVVDIKTLRKELQGLKADIGSSVVRTHLEHSVLVNNQSVIGEMRIGNTRITTGLKEIQLEIKSQKQGVFSAAIGSIFSGFFGGIGMSGGLRMGKGVQATMGVDFGDLGKGVGADLKIKIGQLNDFLNYVSKDALNIPDGFAGARNLVKKNVDAIFTTLTDPKTYKGLEDMGVELARLNFDFDNPKAKEVLNKGYQKTFDLLAQALEEDFARFVGATLKMATQIPRLRKRVMLGDSARVVTENLEVVGQQYDEKMGDAQKRTVQQIEQSTGIVLVVGGNQPQMSKPGQPNVQSTHLMADAIRGVQPGAYVKPVEPVLGNSLEVLANGPVQMMRDLVLQNADMVRRMLSGVMSDQDINALMTQIANKHPMDRMAQVNWEGQDQDAVKVAQEALALAQKFPDKKVNLAGGSFGGHVVEEAIAIINEIAYLYPELKEAASRITGIGIGTPITGLTKTFDSRVDELQEFAAKYTAFIGTLDHVGAAVFGTGFIHGYNSDNPEQRKKAEQVQEKAVITMPTGALTPDSSSVVLPAAGYDHAIIAMSAQIFSGNTSGGKAYASFLKDSDMGYQDIVRKIDEGSIGLNELEEQIQEMVRASVALEQQLNELNPTGAEDVNGGVIGKLEADIESVHENIQKAVETYKEAAVGLKVLQQAKAELDKQLIGVGQKGSPRGVAESIEAMKMIKEAYTALNMVFNNVTPDGYSFLDPSLDPTKAQQIASADPTRVDLPAGQSQLQMWKAKSSNFFRQPELFVNEYAELVQAIDAIGANFYDEYQKAYSRGGEGEAPLFQGIKEQQDPTSTVEAVYSDNKYRRASDVDEQLGEQVSPRTMDIMYRVAGITQYQTYEESLAAYESRLPEIEAMPNKEFAEAVKKTVEAFLAIRRKDIQLYQDYIGQVTELQQKIREGEDTPENREQLTGLIQNSPYGRTGGAMGAKDWFTVPNEDGTGYQLNPERKKERQSLEKLGKSMGAGDNFADEWANFIGQLVDGIIAFEASARQDLAPLASALEAGQNLSQDLKMLALQLSGMGEAIGFLDKSIADRPFVLNALLGINKQMEQSGQQINPSSARFLGQGFTGWVARAELDGQEVAVKHLTTTENEAKVGSAGEIEALQRLGELGLSPKFVQHIPENNALITSMVHGATIQELRDKLSPEQLNEAIKQVGALMRQIHDSGFVHNDMSLANVMVDLAGQLVAIDFANAQRLNEDTNQASQQKEFDRGRSMERSALSEEERAMFMQGYEDPTALVGIPGIAPSQNAINAPSVQIVDPVKVEAQKATAEQSLQKLYEEVEKSINSLIRSAEARAQAIAKSPVGNTGIPQREETAPEEISLASVVGGIQSFHDSFNEFVQWMKSSGKSSGPPPSNPGQQQGGGLTGGNDTDPDILSSGAEPKRPPGGGGGIQEGLVTAGQAVRQATAVGIDKAENLTSAITQTGPGKIATALGTVGLGAGIAQLTGVGDLTADMVQDAVMWAINSIDAEMQSAILNHITQFGDSVGDLVRTAVTTAFPIELDPTVIPEAPPSGVMGHITDAMRNLNNMKNGALQQIVEGMVQTLQDALGGTAQGTANIVGSLIDIPEEQIALVVADVFRAIVDISIGGSGAMLLNKGYRGLSGRALPELNVMREGRPDALLPQEVRLDAADAYARVNKIATELAGDPGPERSGELIQELGTALRELGKAKSRLAKLADEEAGQAIAMIKALEQRAMAVQAEILARNPDITVKKMDSIAKSLSPGAEFQSYLEQAKQSGIYNQDIASSRKTAGKSLQTRLTKDEAVELQKMFRSDEGIKQLMTSLLDTSVAEVMPQSGLLPDVAIAQTRKQVATLAKAMIATFKQEGSLDGVSLDILSGLLKDLVAGKGKLSKEGRELAKELPDVFRKELGIKSPSTVFMAIARDIVAGLEQGLDFSSVANKVPQEITEIIGDIERYLDGASMRLDLFGAESATSNLAESLENTWKSKGSPALPAMTELSHKETGTSQNQITLNPRINETGLGLNPLLYLSHKSHGFLLPKILQQGLKDTSTAYKEGLIEYPTYAARDFEQKAFGGSVVYSAPSLTGREQKSTDFYGDVEFLIDPNRVGSRTTFTRGDSLGIARTTGNFNAQPISQLPQNELLGLKGGYFESQTKGGIDPSEFIGINFGDLEGAHRKYGSNLIEIINKSLSDGIPVFGRNADRLGEALGTGLAQGIYSVADLPIIAAVAGSKDLIEAIKQIYGIASPSKVFMEIGRNLVEGLAQGFTMKQIFASMTAEMKSELAKFTDRMEVGTIANTIDIPLQLQGADVEERIYAVATALEYLSDLREASPVNGDQKKALEQRERARRQASIEFRIKEQGVQANFADDDLPSIAVGEDLNAVEQAAQQLANLLQNAGLLSFLGMGNDITSFGGNTGIPSRDENAPPTVIPPPGAGQPTPEENKIRQLLDWLKKATGIVDPLSGDGFDSALEVPIKTTVTTGESSQIPTIVVAQGGSDVAIEEEIPTGVNANQSAANVAEKLNEVFTSAQESLGNIPSRARALGNSLWNSLLTAFESAIEALGLTEQALQLQSALGLDAEVTAVSSSTGINTSLPTEINTSLPTEVNSSSAQVNTTGNISIPITGPGAPSVGSASVTAPTSSGRIPPTIPSPTGGGPGGSTPPPPPPAPPGSGGLSSSTPTGGNSGSLSSPLSTPTAPLTGPGTSAGTPTGTGSNTSTSSSSASSGQTTTTTTTSTTTTGASQGTTTRTNTNVSAPLPTAPTSGVSGSTPPPPTLPPTTPNSAPTPTPPSPQNPTGAGGTGDNSTGGGSRPTPPPLSSIPPIPPNYVPVGGSGGSGGSTPSSGAGSGPASGGSNPGSGSTPPPPQNPTGASGNPDDDGDFWTRVQRAWFNTIDQPRQGVANINPDEAIRINDSVANGTIGVLDNITEALRLVGITVERTGAFFDELGEKFPLVAEIGGILKDIGIGILSLLGLGAIDQMITDFAQSSIQSAVQIERFKSALLFSPSEMPTTSLKELSKFTKEIGADFLVAAESYTKLVVASSGSNVAPQVESIYKGFQSALTAKGATPDEQQRAFLAVEQIIGKNQIMAEELRGQLAEVMPQALGALSRSLGVTNEELNQMLQTTRLLPETTLMKLAYQLEAESSVAGASIREGVLGDINRTRATAQQIQVGVGQTLLGAADVNLNPMGLVDDTSPKVSPFKIFNFGFEALEKSIGTLTFSLTTLVAVIGFKMVGAIMKAATGMRLFQMASATLGVDLVKSKMLVDLYNNSLTRLGAKQAVVGTSRYNVLRGASILGAGAMGLAKAFAPFLAIGVVMDQITKRLSAQNTEMKKLRIETEKTLSKLIEYGDKAGSLNFQGRRNQDLPTQWFTGNQLSEDWAYNRLTGDQNPLLRFLMGGPASLLSPGRLPQQNLWDMSGYVPYLDADGNKRVERLTREEYVANKTDIEELGKFINIMDQTTKQLFSNISEPGVMQNNQNVMRGLEIDLLKKQNEINLEKSTTADPVKIQQLQSELSRIQEELVEERDKRFGNEQINAQQLEFLNRAEETAKNTIQDEDLKQETLKRIRMEREIRLMLQDAYRESAGALDFNIVAFQRSLGLLNTALANASADLQLRFNVATNTITGQRVGMVPEGQGLRDDEIERLLAQNEVIRADQAVRNTQAVIGQATKNLYEQPYLMEAAGISLGSIPELFNPATGKPYEDPLEAAMRSDKETLNALLENKALQPVVQNYIRAMLVFKDLQELLTSQQGELNQVSRENLRLQEERMLLIRNANTDMASANTRRMMNEMVLNGDLGMQDLPLLEIQARLEEVKERIQTAYGQLALGIDPAVVMPEIANLLAEQSDLEVQARQAQFDLERAVRDQANSVMDFNYSLIQSAMNNARTIRDFWWRVEDTQIQLQREARGLEESWTDLMFGLETQLIDAQNELNRAQNQLEETRASFALESTSPFSQSRGRRVGEIINSMIAELNNSESEIDNLDSQQRQIGQEYIQSLRSIRDEQERQLDAERQRTRTLVQLNEEYQMMLMDMHNQVRTMYAQFANLFAELMMNNPAMAGQLQNPASFNLIPTPYAPQFGGNGFLPPPPFSGVAPQAIGPGGQVNPYYFQQMQAYRQGMGGMGGFYQDPYAYQQRVKTPEEIRAEITQQLSQPPTTPPPARVSETKYPVRNGSGISGYFTAGEIRQMGIPQSQVGEGVRPTQRNYLDQVMQNNLSGRPLTMSSMASNTTLVASSVPIQPSGTGSARIQAYEPLLALIRSGEGGYGSYNRGRAGDSGGQTLEKLFGKPLSQITVNEIIKKQAQSSLFAVGAYQFIPSTLKSAASRTGLGNAPFTPQTQALLAIDLINNKRPEIGRFIASQGSGNFREAIQGLAREWASIGLAYPEAGRRAGQSRYAGTGGNAASISPDRAGNALLEVVRRLQQFGLRSSAGGASGAGGNMSAGGPSLNFDIPESIELGQTAQNAIEKGLLWLFNDVVRPAANFVRPNNQIAPFTWDDITPEKPQPSQPPATQKPQVQPVAPSQSIPSPANILIPPANANNIPAGATPAQLPQTTEQILNWFKTNTGRQSFPVQGLGEQMPFSTQEIKDKIPLEPGRVFINPQRQQGLYDQYQVQPIQTFEGIQVIDPNTVPAFPVQDTTRANQMAGQIADARTQANRTDQERVRIAQMATMLRGTNQLRELALEFERADRQIYYGIYDYNLDLAGLRAAKKGYETAAEQVDAVGRDIRRDFDNRARNFQEQVESIDIELTGYAQAFSVIRDELAKSDVTPERKAELQEMLRIMQEKEPVLRNARDLIVQQWQATNALANETERVAKARRAEEIAMQTQMDYANKFAQLFDTRANSGATNAMGFGTLINPAEVIKARAEAQSALFDLSRQFEGQIPQERFDELIEFQKEINQLNIDQAFVRSVPGLQAFGSEMKSVILNTKSLGEALLAVGNNILDMIVERMTVLPLQRLMGQWLGGVMGLDSNYTYPLYSSEFAQDQLAKTSSSGAVATQIAGFGIEQIMGTDASISLERFKDSTDKASDSLVNTLAVSAIDATLSEAASLAQFTIALQVATAGIYQFVASLGVSTVGNGIGSAVGSVFGNPGNIASTVFDFAKNVFLPTFNDGGFVDDEIPTLSNGGMAGGGAIAKALDKERQLSGKRPMLAVINEAEYVIPAYEAQTYLQWRDIKATDVKNFALGGFTGKAPEIRSSTPQQGKTVINNFTQSNTFKVANSNDVGRSASQANRQQLLDAQRNKLL